MTILRKRGSNILAYVKTLAVQLLLVFSVIYTFPFYSHAHLGFFTIFPVLGVLVAEVLFFYLVEGD